MTETCEEQLNLIVDVQVEPASTADSSDLQEAVRNSKKVLDGPAQEIFADGAYFSAENEAYAKDEEKKIHYTGFPGKAGRYDYKRTEEGIVVITDKYIDAAACRRRTQNLPQELFNRRCNVEATIFQLCYHTNKKKLKDRGKLIVSTAGPAVWVRQRQSGFSEGTQSSVTLSNETQLPWISPSS